MLSSDKRAIGERFDKLRRKYKIKIATEICTVLGEVLEKHENIKYLTVKKKTLDLACEIYKKNSEKEMTQLQIAAVLQVLSLEEVTNDSG